MSKDDQQLIPGMDKFVHEEEEEFFFPGQKNEKFFDSNTLPDIPLRQENANGATTYMMYLLFPSQEDLILALAALTNNARKSLKAGVKIGSLNAMALLPKDPKGRTFLEYWVEELSGVSIQKPKDEDEDEDEAKAPI